ncbi:hypothetical protein GCM10022288_26470 [Gryllotalpicola kribbensis]|uniref:Scaffolding protein n=1 Tax=Gryllotalpicola kribbensis TaxID=993084 RepID=A0ABP8AXV3_9MICO
MTDLAPVDDAQPTAEAAPTPTPTTEGDDFSTALGQLADVYVEKFELPDGARQFLTGATAAELKEQATLLSQISRTAQGAPADAVAPTPNLAPVTGPGNPTPDSRPPFDAVAVARAAQRHGGRS